MLYIRMLGAFRWSKDSEAEQFLGGLIWHHILAYLAFRDKSFPQSVPREQILKAVWEDAAEERGLTEHTLNLHLPEISKALAGMGVDPNSFLVRKRLAGVSLNPDSYTTDVREFRRHFAAAEREKNEKNTNSERLISHLHSAVSLYHGPLLDGMHRQWIESERETLLRQYESARQALNDLDSAGRIRSALHPIQTPPPPISSQNPRNAVQGIHRKAEPGYFRKLGTIHVHIDAGSSLGAASRVAEIVTFLQERGFMGKLNEITKAVSGPQRYDEDYRETYAIHTPGEGGQERFEIFSTTSFGERDEIGDDIINSLKHILRELSETRGIIVEVERTVAMITDNGNWVATPNPLIPTIEDHKVGTLRSRTHPIEIHHALDVAKIGDETDPPITIEEVLRAANELGIKFGGWFLFDKGDAWSYRSSAFTGYDDYKEEAQEYHFLLAQYLDRRLSGAGRTYKVWTLVEQILGIWNTGRRVSSREGLLSVAGLAEWEKSCPAGCEFWVITPNFLGDKDPDVFQAMLDNLMQGVHYVYFLQAFSDAQRLRELIGRLSSALNRDVSEDIRIVLLPPNDLNAALRAEWFVAIPGASGHSEGYKLNRNRHGYVVSGVRVDRAELDWLVDLLSPIIRADGIGGIRLPAKRTFEVHDAALAYTDLEGFAEHLGKTAPEQWESLLREYDLIVATEVSKAGGRVERVHGNGYLLSFTNTRSAARCAKRLQRSLEEHNHHHRDLPPQQLPRQRVALVYGHVRRIECSHGYDLRGHILSMGEKIIEFAEGSHILMTQEFYDNAMGHFGAERFLKMVTPLNERAFRNYPCPLRLYELLWSKNDGSQIEPMGSVVSSEHGAGKSEDRAEWNGAQRG